MTESACSLSASGGGRHTLPRSPCTRTPEAATVPPVGLLSRRQKRLRPFDEAGAYSRCHGYRTQTVIAITRADESSSEPVTPFAKAARATHQRDRVSGEQLRQRFEELLDARQKQE